MIPDRRPAAEEGPHVRSFVRSFWLIVVVGALSLPASADRPDSSSRPGDELAASAAGVRERMVAHMERASGQTIDPLDVAFVEANGLFAASGAALGLEFLDAQQLDAGAPLGYLDLAPGSLLGVPAGVYEVEVAATSSSAVPDSGTWDGLLLDRHGAVVLTVAAEVASGGSTTVPRVGLAVESGALSLSYTTATLTITLSLPATATPGHGHERDGDDDTDDRTPEAPRHGFAPVEELTEAARARGLALDSSRLVAGASLAQVVAAAPVRGLDALTLAQVAKGAVIGLAYLDLPSELGVPSGFYTLRLADAEAVIPTFSLSLLDSAGNAVALFSAELGPAVPGAPSGLGFGLQGPGLVLALDTPLLHGGVSLGTLIPLIGILPGPPRPIIRTCVAPVVPLPPPGSCSSPNNLTGGFELAQEYADTTIAGADALKENLPPIPFPQAVPFTAVTASGTFDLRTSSLGPPSTWFAPGSAAVFHLATAADLCGGSGGGSLEDPPVVFKIPFLHGDLEGGPAGSQVVEGTLEIFVSLDVARGVCAGDCCGAPVCVQVPCNPKTDNGGLCQRCAYPNKASVNLDFTNSAPFAPVVVLSDVHGQAHSLSNASGGPISSDPSVVAATVAAIEEAYASALESQVGAVNYLGQCLNWDGGGRLTDLLDLASSGGATPSLDALHFADLALVGVGALDWDGSPSSAGLPGVGGSPGSAGTFGSPPEIALLGTIWNSDVPNDCAQAKTTSMTTAQFSSGPTSPSFAPFASFTLSNTLPAGAMPDASGVLPLRPTQSLLFCSVAYGALLPFQRPGPFVPLDSLATAGAQAQAIHAFLPSTCGCAGKTFLACATTDPSFIGDATSPPPSCSTAIPGFENFLFFISLESFDIALSDPSASAATGTAVVTGKLAVETNWNPSFCIPSGSNCYPTPGFGCILVCTGYSPNEVTFNAPLALATTPHFTGVSFGLYSSVSPSAIQVTSSSLETKSVDGYVTGTTTTSSFPNAAQFNSSEQCVLPSLLNQFMPALTGLPAVFTPHDSATSAAAAPQSLGLGVEYGR